MGNTAQTPGQKFITDLTGEERVEIRTGAQVAETTTQAIADLGGAPGDAVVTTGAVTAGHVAVFIDTTHIEDGGAPGGDGFTDLANDPDTTTGLTYGYKAGKVYFNGAVATAIFLAGTVELTDNEDNYFYISYFSDDPLVSVVKPLPIGVYLVAIVTAAAGEITNINDKRSPLTGIYGEAKEILNDLVVIPQSGLDVLAVGGQANTPVGEIIINGATLTLPDDTPTIYIEYDVTGTASFNTVGWTPGSYPAALAATSGGQATINDDSRTSVFIPGPGVIRTNAHNTSAGTNSLVNNIDPVDSTAFGFHALDTATAGAARNTATGSTALAALTTGTDNTAVGAAAMAGSGPAITGVKNTAVGSGALTSVGVGGSNVAVGWNAGDAITTGSRNTFLGTDADDPTGTGSNRTAVGSAASALTDNVVQLGDSSVIAVRVGTGAALIVSALPAPSADLKGARAFITDGAAVPVFGAIAAGAGALFLPVFCDGANWRNG